MGDNTIKKTEEAETLSPKGRKDFELKSPRRCRKITGLSPTSAQSVSKWELQLEEGWVPFLPGVKYKDQAGVQQELFYRNSWYKLAFDLNGTTGSQTNLFTRKARPLRLAQEVGEAKPEDVVGHADENVAGQCNDVK